MQRSACSQGIEKTLCWWGRSNFNWITLFVSMHRRTATRMPHRIGSLEKDLAAAGSSTMTILSDPTRKREGLTVEYALSDSGRNTELVRHQWIA